MTMISSLILLRKSNPTMITFRGQCVTRAFAKARQSSNSHELARRPSDMSTRCFSRKAMPSSCQALVQVTNHPSSIAARHTATGEEPPVQYSCTDYKILLRENVRSAPPVSTLSRSTTFQLALKALDSRLPLTTA